MGEETQESGDHDRFRGVIEPLSGEFDVVDIALAAVSLIDGAERRDEDEVELAPAFLGGPTGPGVKPRRPNVPPPLSDT